MIRHTDTSQWQPGTTPETLRERARIIATLRQYFAAHNVLEVDTPIASHAASSEVHLASWQVQPAAPGAPTLYLQTSPELAMKRLLAAGSGDIYQLCKVFRATEYGRYHNPEFSLLEWYRLGFDMPALMQDVEALLRTVLEKKLGAPALTLTYRQAFLDYVGLDPFRATPADLKDAYLQRSEQSVQGVCDEDWLDLIFAERVQPALPVDRIVFVSHFPAAQASLAKLDPADPRCALRFEVFVNGIELANGFEELTDPVEQGARIAAEQQRRQALGLPIRPVDERFLAALSAGLPACSGVAMGVDRLVMLALGQRQLRDVLAFDFERC